MALFNYISDTIYDFTWLFGLLVPVYFCIHLHGCRITGSRFGGFLTLLTFILFVNLKRNKTWIIEVISDRNSGSVFGNWEQATLVIGLVLSQIIFNLLLKDHIHSLPLHKHHFGLLQGLLFFPWRSFCLGLPFVVNLLIHCVIHYQCFHFV